jgi:glycogen debranching enzyme
VLTLQKTDSAAAISVSMSDRSVDELLNSEWLLTNGRGSYASSTIVGCNTRRYHGLLIGSLRPPVNRVMALSNCLEMIISNGKAFNLSTFEFDGKFAPEGYGFLKRFRRDIGAHFDYELEKVELTKSVYFHRDVDMVALLYDFIHVPGPVEFVLRPFVGLRDFHSLQKSFAPLYSRRHGDSVLVQHDSPNSCQLLLSCRSANFETDPQWWFNFLYRVDRERSQDFVEDLWSPGFYKCRIEAPIKVVLWASLRPFTADRKNQFIHSGNTDIEKIRKDLYKHDENLRHKVKSVKRDYRLAVSRSETGQLKMPMLKMENGRLFETLCLAADHFITRRQTDGHYRTTILAGYPWFADWGRDAFISLPGLLLLSGRFEQAKSVLTTFAASVDDGMIPNRFDDISDTTYFNSVDASLWFINAAFQYFQVSGDSKVFMQELMPTIRWIIDSYHKGTRFGIRADEDGLITAGNEQTQLTWMDAKYEGIAFTPRYGKAVEVNALWYNSLCLLSDFYYGRDLEIAKRYESMADKVRVGFCEMFWNENRGYLNDCILPDGTIDDSLRPNQLFAVSLSFSPLSFEQQESIVNVVRERLLTPYGLRTLDPSASNYKGQYLGPQRQRDEAYHQGTVWPFLMGAFIESFLKVNEFSRKSKKQAAEFVQPLLQHFIEKGCIGSVSEIFDGDTPHRPRGCIAQAWSVAELIRAYQLINS